MTNIHIVEMLDEIARLLELAGEDPAEIGAYARGARLVQNLSEPAENLLASDQVSPLDALEEGPRQQVAESVATGRSEYLEELRHRFTEELLEVLRVPGLSPGRVRALYQEHRIDSLERLRWACETGEIAGLCGLGPQAQQQLLHGVEVIEGQRRLFRVNDAMRSAQLVHAWMLEGSVAQRVEIAGSLRRRREVVGNINLVAAAGSPGDVLDRFAAYPEMAEVTGRQAEGAQGMLTNGIPVAMHVVAPSLFGAALVHYTGSRAHNHVLRKRARARGLSWDGPVLRAAGGGALFCAEEAACYAALDLPWIPAELRENRGECDAAFFPRLVEPADLRGVVHCHSTWSDGKTTLEDLAEAAAGLGYDYLVITDHSAASHGANGMTPETVARQHAAIDALNRQMAPFHVVKGVEVDILADGALDYGEALLGQFEVVIASVHSALEMGEEQATKRLVRAMENRNTMILGHLSGRMLLARPGYPVNVDRIVDAAVANGVAMEINVNPGRLDFDWRHLRKARDRGVKFVIGPDAHRIRGLSNIPYGVGVARKGWLRREDVLNCRPLGDFLQCLRKR